jgi:segregation and condensation protein A
MNDTRPEPLAPPVEEGAPPSDGWRVRLQAFDGPLDLLLHLVRVNEVEITDIPIVEITRQYDAYLDLMRDLDLEIAGDYLVLAATLMHIKSRMLLPPDPVSDEESAGDPRAELVQQLLDYQRYKQAAEGLEALESRRTLIWTRMTIPDEFGDEELLAVDMFDLLGAFRKLLSRLGEEAKLAVRGETVSVADKIVWLTDLLAVQSSLVLTDLLADLPTRVDRIAAFLALLEMMRLRMVVCFQRTLFDEIRVVRAEPLEAQHGRA